MSTLARLDWIIVKTETAEHRLTPWERGFIDGLSHRRAKQGDRLTLTERQWEILESIAEKAS